MYVPDQNAIFCKGMMPRRNIWPANTGYEIRYVQSAVDSFFHSFKRLKQIEY